jgi:HPr kinase/phosphorylase
VETIVHGTCVALSASCAVIRGPSGAGKSDLALRFLFLPSEYLGTRPALIADDQVILRRTGDRIIASCPAVLAGKIEVRGAGIAQLPVVAREAELKLLVDLDETGNIMRLPERAEWENLLDLSVRRITLDPFEASAPIKLALAMQNSFGETVD